MSVDQTALRNLAVVAVAFLARNIAQLATRPSERAYTPPFPEKNKKKHKLGRINPNKKLIRQPIFLDRRPSERVYTPSFLEQQSEKTSSKNEEPIQINIYLACQPIIDL